MKKKSRLLLLVSFIFMVCLSGCAKWQSVINDLHGSLIGNSYSIYTYDNYGSQTLKTSGNKISITGNKIETTSFDSEGKTITGYDLSSVITITIDGKEIENCGDTCIFSSNGGGRPASIARVLNKYKNDFGKSRVVVIKSQLGQPIAAFSGDDVYWEVPEDLPKMTKLMIDGKALYIHRANYQIVDKALL